MPAWLAPVLTGLASAGGELISSSRNRAEAERNRRFQERMSSTAAQRAVRDYAAAGLNPALAYERPASSPGGSVAAPEGNPLERGVSSALAARQAQAQVKVTEAQAEKLNEEAALLKFDRSLREVTVGDEPSWREEQIAARRGRIRDIGFAGTMQPHQLRTIALENLLKELQVPRSQLLSGAFGDVGAIRDFIKAGIGDAKGAAEALNAWMRVRESIRERDRLNTRKLRY